MAWHQLIFAVTAEEAEEFSDTLLTEGALTVSIEHHEMPGQPEVEVFGEPGYDTQTLWPNCSLKVLLDLNENPQELMERTCKALNLDTIPPFQVDTIHDQDWVRLTQSQFEPIQINPHLWIVPSWHTPPDNNAINIQIDPGQAFGTGSHATTQLCLNALVSCVNNKTTVLDYGCGSGILAIAAGLLGAASVTGVDIDEAAVEAAKNNAAINNVSAHFYNTSSWQTDQVFDIVVANILSAPLKVLAPLLASYVKPGGTLILSGLLSKQTTEMIGFYQPWLTLVTYKVQEEWVCLMGKK